MNEMIWCGTGTGRVSVCPLCICHCGSWFVLELLNSGVELFEGPLAVLFALEICARSEVLRAMTRDDISQVYW